MHCRIVGADVVPEFMPKHNCGLIRTGGQTAGEAARPEIGDKEGAGVRVPETLSRHQSGAADRPRADGSGVPADAEKQGRQTDQ